MASGSTAAGTSGGRGSQVFFRPVSEEPESATATVRESYWSDGNGGGGGGDEDDAEEEEEDDDDRSSDEGRRRRHHQRMLRDPPLPTRIPREDRLSRVSLCARAAMGRGINPD